MKTHVYDVTVCSEILTTFRVKANGDDDAGYIAMRRFHKRMQSKKYNLLMPGDPAVYVIEPIK